MTTAWDNHVRDTSDALSASSSDWARPHPNISMPPTGGNYVVVDRTYLYGLYVVIIYIINHFDPTSWMTSVHLFSSGGNVGYS